MKSKFVNKNVLIIMPKYFGYEKEICKTVQAEGGNVRLVYENVDYISIFYNLLLKCFSGSKTKILYRYYNRKIGEFKPDVVIVIRGSMLYEPIIKEMVDRFSNAKFYMYQWDSIQNNKNAEVIAKYFDKVSTFDIDDAKAKDWNYRPLFYVLDSDRTKKRKYDFTYICSLHSKRLGILKDLKKKYGNYCNYLYVFSGFLHYVMQKYVKHNESFTGVKENEIRFKPLSLYDTNKILADSNIVIDYTHPQQTGFTMRTIESIGHRCKLVTNNDKVYDSDFYLSNNVYVYDDEDFFVPQDFVDSPYQELDKDIYTKYGIGQWLEDITT